MDSYNQVYISDIECSCGVWALDGVKFCRADPKPFVKEMLTQLWNRQGGTVFDLRCAHIIFSDKVNSRGRRNFVKFLETNKFHFVESKSQINPNSKNRILTYVWTINKNTAEELAKLAEWSWKDYQSYRQKYLKHHW